tara:strand:+ start:12257 stop:12466 length:210 start_codon:yes stop_codon:yes gene_type:complete
MLLLVGDVIKLKPRFIVNGSSSICTVIKIESFKGTDWLAYDYVAMLTTGQLIRITESCVEEIISSTLKF